MASSRARSLVRKALDADENEAPEDAEDQPVRKPAARKALFSKRAPSELPLAEIENVLGFNTCRSPPRPARIHSPDMFDDMEEDEKELGRKSNSTIQDFLEDWNPSSDFLKEVEDLSNGFDSCETLAQQIVEPDLEEDSHTGVTPLPQLAVLNHDSSLAQEISADDDILSVLDCNGNVLKLTCLKNVSATENEEIVFSQFDSEGPDTVSSQEMLSHDFHDNIPQTSDNPASSMELCANTEKYCDTNPMLAEEIHRSAISFGNTGTSENAADHFPNDTDSDTIVNSEEVILNNAIPNNAIVLPLLDNNDGIPVQDQMIIGEVVIAPIGDLNTTPVPDEFEQAVLTDNQRIPASPIGPNADNAEQEELPLFGPKPRPPTKSALKQENKKRKSVGEEYTNSRGEVVPSKRPKEVTCKCQFPTCNTLTPEQINSLNEAYWKLGDYSRQRDYLVQCTKSVPVKRHRKEAVNRRERTFEYSFRVKDEEGLNELDVRVCRTKFLAVLNIGKKTLSVTKRNEENGFSCTDMRGRHAPKHKLKPCQTAAVIEHIASFPKVESHYCRQSSSLEYLDQKLTIRFMHRLYKLLHSGNSELLVGYETYRRIFRSEFHLAFHKPKKDQCSTCAAFKNLSDTEKELKKEEFARHIENKTKAQQMKELHKEDAMKNESFKTFTFDLQSVLYTPCSEVSDFYYKRKFNSYDLTIYDQATRDGTCYFWDETEGKKGSSEIGTALWMNLLSLPEEVKRVSFFSDSCGGQNRNRYIAALFLHAVRVLHFEQIDHCFLESGHTYMEVDSMHSCIERAKEGICIYAPTEWIPIMRSARQFSKTKEDLQIRPYNVKTMTHKDILDLKALKTDTITRRLDVNLQGAPVNWMKIKRIRYQKSHPESIFYTTDYENEFNEMSAPYPKTSSQKKRGRPAKRSQGIQGSFNYELKQCYSERLPISSKKKADLLSLCNSRLIPDEFHEWYKSIPCDSSVQDRLAMPDVTEEDEDGPAVFVEDEEEQDLNNDSDDRDSS